MSERILAPTLDAFERFVEADDGIALDKLPSSTTFIVRTISGSVYEVTVLSPEKSEVRVKGGKLLQEPQVCRFNGSTCGGSTIVSKWIGVGMRLEFCMPNGETLITSCVEAISLLTPFVSDKVH